MTTAATSSHAVTRTALRVPSHLTEEITADGIVVFVSREHFEAFAVDLPLGRGKPKKRAYWTTSRQKLRFNPNINLADEKSSAAAKLTESIATTMQARARDVAEYRSREARKASLDATEHFQAGDFVVYSWGCEQTNIHFFQVEAVTGKSVTLRRVKTDKVYGDGANSLSGTITPRAGDFDTSRIGSEDNGTRRVHAPFRSDSGAFVKFAHGFGYRWNGKPENFSEYA